MQNRAVSAFVNVIPTFVYLNGTPDEIVVQSYGATLHVPATDKVTPEHPKFKDVFCSLKRQDGSYVPGTLVTYSRTQPGQLGSTDVIWDAKHAAIQVLGIVQEDMTSPAANRGLRLIPVDATDAEIDSIRQESRKSWERWTVNDARQKCGAWDQTVARFKASGMPIPPPPDDIVRAMDLLKHLEGTVEPVDAASTLLAERQRTAEKQTFISELAKDPEMLKQLLRLAVETTDKEQAKRASR